MSSAFWLSRGERPRDVARSSRMARKPVAALTAVKLTQPGPRRVGPLAFRGFPNNTPAGFFEYPPIVYPIPPEGFLTLAQLTGRNRFHLQILYDQEGHNFFLATKS